MQPALNEVDNRIKGRCDGCKHCRWIAPGGQLWRNDPQPQMHCGLLGRLEVVARKGGDYDHTLIPAGCPEHHHRAKDSAGRSGEQALKR